MDRSAAMETPPRTPRKELVRAVFGTSEGRALLDKIKERRSLSNKAKREESQVVLNGHDDYCDDLSSPSRDAARRRDLKLMMRRRSRTGDEGLEESVCGEHGTGGASTDRHVAAPAIADCTSQSMDAGADGHFRLAESPSRVLQDVIRDGDVFDHEPSRPFFQPSSLREVPIFFHRGLQTKLADKMTLGMLEFGFPFTTHARAVDINVGAAATKAARLQATKPLERYISPQIPANARIVLITNVDISEDDLDERGIPRGSTVVLIQNVDAPTPAHLVQPVINVPETVNAPPRKRSRNSLRDTARLRMRLFNRDGTEKGEFVFTGPREQIIETKHRLNDFIETEQKRKRIRDDDIEGPTYSEKPAPVETEPDMDMDVEPEMTHSTRLESVPELVEDEEEEEEEQMEPESMVDIRLSLPPLPDSPPLLPQEAAPPSPPQTPAVVREILPITETPERARSYDLDSTPADKRIIPYGYIPLTPPITPLTTNRVERRIEFFPSRDILAPPSPPLSIIDSPINYKTDNSTPPTAPSPPPVELLESPAMSPEHRLIHGLIEETIIEETEDEDEEEEEEETEIAPQAPLEDDEEDVEEIIRSPCFYGKEFDSPPASPVAGAECGESFGMMQSAMPGKDQWLEDNESPTMSEITTRGETPAPSAHDDDSSAASSHAYHGGASSHDSSMVSKSGKRVISGPHRRVSQELVRKGSMEVVRKVSRRGAESPAPGAGPVHHFHYPSHYQQQQHQPQYLDDKEHNSSSSEDDEATAGPGPNNNDTSNLALTLHRTNSSTSGPAYNYDSAILDDDHDLYSTPSRPSSCASSINTLHRRWSGISRLSYNTAITTPSTSRPGSAFSNHSKLLTYPHTPITPSTRLDFPNFDHDFFTTSPATPFDEYAPDLPTLRRFNSNASIPRLLFRDSTPAQKIREPLLFPDLPNLTSSQPPLSGSVTMTFVTEHWNLALPLLLPAPIPMTAISADSDDEDWSFTYTTGELQLLPLTRGVVLTRPKSFIITSTTSTHSSSGSGSSNGGSGSEAEDEAVVTASKITLPASPVSSRKLPVRPIQRRKVKSMIEYCPGEGGEMLEGIDELFEEFEDMAVARAVAQAGGASMVSLGTVMEDGEGEVEGAEGRKKKRGLLKRLKEKVRKVKERVEEKVERGKLKRSASRGSMKSVKGEVLGEVKA